MESNETSNTRMEYEDDLRATSDVTRAEITQLLETSDPISRCRGLKLLAIIADSDCNQHDEDIPSLEDHLTDQHSSVRNTAAEVMEALVPYDYESLEADVPILVDRLEDDSELVRRTAITSLIAVAEVDPDTVKTAIPLVINRLSDDQVFIQEPAVEFLSVVVSEYPLAVQRGLERYLELIGEKPEESTFEVVNRSLKRGKRRREIVSQNNKRQRQYRTISETASYIVCQIADESPENVEPYVDKLTKQLSDESHVRKGALSVIKTLGAKNPDVIRDIRADLVQCLKTASCNSVAGLAVQTLGVGIDSHPNRIVSAIIPEFDVVIDLLQHDDPSIRGAAIGLLPYVAERHSEIVEPAAEDVVSLLYDEHAFVRGNAVETLRYLSTDEGRMALVDRRDNDPDPRVRKVARAVLDMSS